jgi:hypothetical protein
MTRLVEGKHAQGIGQQDGLISRVRERRQNLLADTNFEAGTRSGNHFLIS